MKKGLVILVLCLCLIGGVLAVDSVSRSIRKGNSYYLELDQGRYIVSARNLVVGGSSWFSATLPSGDLEDVYLKKNETKILSSGEATLTLDNVVNRRAIRWLRSCRRIWYYSVRYTD